MMETIFWKKLTAQFNLGHFKKVAPTSGGMLHKLFYLQTDVDEFAVKILDPWLVNQYSISRWENSEQLAHQFLNHSIPASVAMRFDNQCVQQSGAEFILFYPWCQGEVVFAKNVNVQQAKKMGHLLAQLHLANDENLKYISLEKKMVSNFSPQHWNNLVSQLNNNQLFVLATLLEEQLPLLGYFSVLAEKAWKQKAWVLSHRDLQPRNVIWQKTGPVIIDWEYAGWITPDLDLLLTAWDWSDVISGQVNRENFKAVFSGYASKKELPLINDETLYSYYAYCLDWLDLCIRRVIAKPEHLLFAKDEIINVTRALQTAATFFNETCKEIAEGKRK